MAGISRYEKMVLCATGVCLVTCAGIMLTQIGGGESYRITAKPGTAQVVQLPEGAPESMLPGERININTAPAKELERLPGIGESRAADIVEYRQEFGPFQSPDDLMKISGIGEATLAGLREYITID